VKAKVWTPGALVRVDATCRVLNLPLLGDPGCSGPAVCWLSVWAVGTVLATCKVGDKGPGDRVALLVLGPDGTGWTRASLFLQDISEG